MHLLHASARSPRRGRRGRLGAAALALLVVVAACSSGDDDTDADTAASSDATSGADPATTAGGSDGTADSAAFPVTIEHKYGETTIEAPPERVVSVGFADQDLLLALGIVPVAIRDWYGDQPFATWPWATPALGDAEPDRVAIHRAELRADPIARSRPHRRGLVGHDRGGVRNVVGDRADTAAVGRVHRLRSAVAGGHSCHRRGDRSTARGGGVDRRCRRTASGSSRRPPGVGWSGGGGRLRPVRDGDRRVRQCGSPSAADGGARLRDTGRVRRAGRRPVLQLVQLRGDGPPRSRRARLDLWRSSDQ